MKKWIVILATLLLVTVMALPAFAASTEFTFEASSQKVTVGDEITVKVNISTDVPYTSVIVDDIFDEQVFELVEFTIANAPFVGMSDYSDDVLVGTFDDNNTYSGLLLTIKLKVKQNVAPTTTTIGGGSVAAKNMNDAVAVTGKPVEIQVTCRHNFEWVKKDDNQHTGTCTVCGESVEETHDWADEPTDVEPATCTKPGSETRHCLLCDATKKVDIQAKGHAWDNDCDPDCNNGCGETRETGHQYSDKWSSDEKNHWHACTVCGDKKDVTAHKPGAAATEKDPQVCTECTYVIKEALKHVHDYDTSIWQQDSESHWHVCKKPGCYTHGASEKHVYDDECDVSCNVCGHIRIAPHHYGTEWQGNIYGHWMVCVLCGEQSSIMPHIPGDEATEETPQICTECQYWVKYPLSHEHSYDMIWETDDYNHWRACRECGEITAPMPHSWDEGVVIEEATETKDGQKSYTCLDCGYKRIVLIPMEGTQTDPTQPTVDNDDPFNPTQQTDPAETRPTITPPNEKEEFPWWILVVAAATLLVTGIVLFLIEFIRSRKHNMHGKFSK